MYTAYFGLKEAPFTIAPNPAFLFMSDRHREALAHLTFGLGDNGGFVLLTGEVGTGKTTICRSVMEQLPENTQASFILNPTLSCEELLAAICDNLKIRYKKTGATLKYLTDKIQDKLLKNHKENINTLLIIDEAQHLKPEVLEQLRLLTNLETNTQKLLQVILIGQPELQQLLQRRDLRQLAQRITARYHLLPLTKEEVKQYIQHRLSVAQCTRQLFNNAAISTIHRISKGIPRVINLLCDRSLINAYSNNDALVNKKIATKSAIDALGDEGKTVSTWFADPMKFAYGAMLLAITLAGGFWLGQKPSLEVAYTASDATKEQSSNYTAEKVAANKAIVNDVTNTSSISEKPIVKVTDEQSALLARIAALENRITAQTAEIKDKTTELSIEPVEQAKIVGYQPEKFKDRQIAAIQSKQEFTVTATEGVSNELLARFQSAINDTNDANSTSTESTLQAASDSSNDEFYDSEIKSLLDMPKEIQDSVPALQFEQHVFASDGQGWVRVNGEDKHQGEEITEGLALVNILPQKVILSFHGEQFSLPALSSW